MSLPCCACGAPTDGTYNGKPACLECYQAGRITDGLRVSDPTASHCENCDPSFTCWAGGKCRKQPTPSTSVSAESVNWPGVIAVALEQICEMPRQQNLEVSQEIGAQVAKAFEHLRAVDRATIERLTAQIHDLCHDKHTQGPVTPEDFCAGCEVFQIKLFGRSPTAETIARLESELASGGHSVRMSAATVAEMATLRADKQRLEAELAEAKNLLAVTPTTSLCLHCGLKTHHSTREHAAAEVRAHAYCCTLNPLRIELAASESKVAQLCQDWADADTEIRALAKPFMDVDGDTNYVPPMVALVETLAVRLTAAERAWKENESIAEGLADKLAASQEKLAAVTKERDEAKAKIEPIDQHSYYRQCGELGEKLATATARAERLEVALKELLDCPVIKGACWCSYQGRDNIDLYNRCAKALAEENA